MELVRERNTCDIKTRVTPSQLKAIKSLADELGMTMSDYVRYCITKVANEG